MFCFTTVDNTQLDARCLINWFVDLLLTLLPPHRLFCFAGPQVAQNLDEKNEKQNMRVFSNSGLLHVFGCHLVLGLVRKASMQDIAS